MVIDYNIRLKELKLYNNVYKPVHESIVLIVTYIKLVVLLLTFGGQTFRSSGDTYIITTGFNTHHKSHVSNSDEINALVLKHETWPGDRSTVSSRNTNDILFSRERNYFSVQEPSSGYQTSVNRNTDDILSSRERNCFSVKEPNYEYQTSVSRNTDNILSSRERNYFSVKEPGSEYQTSVSRNTDDILSSRERNYFSVKEPGYEYLTSVSRTFNEGKFDFINNFYINVSNCKDLKYIHISSKEGYIRGVLVDTNNTGATVTCFWKITIPEGHSILATVEMMKDHCSRTALIEVSEDEILNKDNLLASIECSSKRTKMIIVTLSNNVFCRFQDVLFIPGYSVTQFQMSFTSVIKSLRRFLPVVYESFHSGYITSPGFNEDSEYPTYLNASFQLDVPAHHTVMISFQCFNIQIDFNGECTIDKVNLFTKEANSELNLEWSECREHMIPTRVYNTSLLVNFVTDGSALGGVGFKMLFSIHPVTHTPLQFDNGLFDCSVPHYVTFKRHLECNLEPECQDGRDEENCPFSNPACNGSLAWGNKCYTFYYAEEKISWEMARLSCQDKGGDLAMPKFSSERDAVRKLLSYGRSMDPACIGLAKSVTRINYGAGSLYANLWHWVDGTIAYDAKITGRMVLFDRMCAVYRYNNPSLFSVSDCLLKPYLSYICETYVENNIGSVKTIHFNFPSSNDLEGNLKKFNATFVRCQDGHITHSFLSCQPESSCVEASLSLWCRVSNANILKTDVMTIATHNDDIDDFTSTAMFVCSDGKRTLHYTMVCDFKRDCIDGSDEDFCQYDHRCPEYTCRNSQCIRFKQACDNINHCWDGSDEDMCSGILNLKEVNQQKETISLPAIIDFDIEENIIRKPFHPSSPCPVTHFRCHGELSYCLPVYLRCNGVYDCPDGEDEDDCKTYVCPGLYRCFNSSVCVHVDHLCDGWPQCPERDDEMLCGFRCPMECQSQGLAFICHQYFLVAAYPDIRYLDADESKLSTRDVSKNAKLVWLRLSRCNIDHVHDMQTPNLRTLDLSDNLITYVDMNVFYKLSKLVELNLAGNPIVYLKKPSDNVEHSYLQRLDLSRTSIPVFDSTALKSFPHINFLNISHGNILAIEVSGFIHIPELKTLDIRGNTLEIFSKDILKQLPQLEVIFAENYKFCCKAILPERFHEDFCFAPKDEISSCEDLLNSNVYRVFNWIVASMTVFGNMGCFVIRVFVQKVNSRSGYGVFVINLSVADFLMGLYLMLVGGADQLYLGNYIWNEHSWITSATCKLAGFSSLVSIEVSSMIIFLITLDRFIVLRFPFSTFSFQGRSAALACGIAWMIGIMLAIIPLLPMTSHWHFYGRTGICVSLPLTREKYPGKTYSFGLIIMFNFVLFILIAVGQFIVYISIQVNSMTTKTTRKSNDSTIARRLLFVVLSNFLCSFPIGLLALLATVGTVIPGDVFVPIIIFILPVNAALNPFVYTLNMLAEKRRKSKELELLAILKDRLQSEKYDSLQPYLEQS